MEAPQDSFNDSDYVRFFYYVCYIRVLLSLQDVAAITGKFTQKVRKRSRMCF